MPALILTVILLFSLPAAAQPAAEESWVARSDRNAQVLLEVLARFNPEGAGFMGIDGLEREILQLPPDRNLRRVEALEAAIAELESRLDVETDARVKLDLEILIGSARFNVRRIRLTEDVLLPYVDLPQTVFQGIRALLDEQVSAEDRAAAEVRLRRYTGAEDGYRPLTEQAEALVRSRLGRSELEGPYINELERNLGNTQRYLDGIRDLLASFEIAGCDEYVDALERQLAVSDDFLRAEVLPRARRDARLPPAVYEMLLEEMGVDMPVDELARRGMVAFREIQNEMRVLAGLIAEERQLADADYRDVLRHLRRDQLSGESILEVYTARIDQLERLIEEHDVVTLPSRKMRIRLATEAESAAIPSPFMRPPRLIGNTGEMGEFVLPFRVPATQEGESSQVPDYTFEAASWTLAVHEGRPGHELQFSSMIENGVSLTRSIFAFNYVNVEGWALYCEAEMKPTFPLDGQLVSLQHRLLRAARAFLDPGMQSGAISEAEALRLLEHDVVLSPSLARQEIDRYTFLDPAQAVSYFAGYLRLMELRAEVEQKLGDDFDRRAFHDLILAQGLLPPRLLRRTVLEELGLSATSG
ncbi:MAG: DUF885 domain-containing protein [Thermoanaerobaculales bacterium]|nr:DUF885 domain-containing protein [Thermoanaerobaculales bacterium]